MSGPVLGGGVGEGTAGLGHAIGLCVVLVVLAVGTGLAAAQDPLAPPFPPDGGPERVDPVADAPLETPVGGGVSPEEAVEVVGRDTEDVEPVLLALRSALVSIGLVRERLEEKQRELATAVTQEERLALLEELNTLNGRLAASERNFESLATGIDVEGFTGREGETMVLSQQIDELLAPILGELKGATEQPRVIERLRREISSGEHQLQEGERALANIGRLLEQTDEGTPEHAMLLEVQRRWNERVGTLNSEVEIARFQLEGLLRNRESVLDTATGAVTRFFSTRGRNLLLGLVAFGAVFLGLRFLQGRLHRISPWHRRKGKPFYVRLIDVVYYLLTFLCALGAALLVLYAAGDWVLLGLALVLLLGLVLAAKNGLPKVWNQVRLLMNLGDVREGERVVYRGIPWEVASVHFYTKLHNPALTGGWVRLPLDQLPGMNSRSFDPREPWFPCHEEDWVLLSDGTRGKVLVQTPQVVQLVLLGGSKKTYLTEDFLGLSPENLSSNFRLVAVFGLDYQHQAICTTEIPEKLWERLTREVTEIVGRDGLMSLKVEFEAAGPSSLDYAIIADFAGEVAAKYEVLKRALQRIAVDTCNENGWVIPFTQVTVHDARTGRAGTGNHGVTGGAAAAVLPEAPPEDGGARAQGGGPREPLP